MTFCRVRGDDTRSNTVIGAPNAAGTRYTANLETPSLNSYVYEAMSCPA